MATLTSSLYNILQIIIISDDMVKGRVYCWIYLYKQSYVYFNIDVKTSNNMGQ